MRSLSSVLWRLSRLAPVKGFVSSIGGGNKDSSRYLFKKHEKKARKYSANDLILNGTSIVDGASVALINDEIYEIGDVINGKKVISIGLDKVELQDDEKIFTLRVR